MGRAALRLATEGIELIFGDRLRAGQMSGWVADADDGWRAVADRGIDAAYDRFPSRWYPERYQALCRERGDAPLANPPALIRLCQDKLATQTFAEGLDVPIPEIEADPTHFAERLVEWPAGVLKPRFGTAGRDVSFIRAGQPMPERRPLPAPYDIPGRTTMEVDGPWFLQRAVPPLAPWRGVCVRVAAQRQVDGTWHRCPAVARYSDRDPVINAARGSQISPAAEILPMDTQAEVARLCERVCQGLARAPGGAWMVEVGMDFAIDSDARPWLLELNARPLGRLGALAARRPEAFAEAHLQACMRPLRFLAAAAQRMRRAPRAQS